VRATDGSARLAREAGAALAALPARLRRQHGLAAPVAALLMLTLPSGALEREDPRALYRAGAFVAAAEGFRAEVDRAPFRWRGWYNLAAAHYLAGRDATAAAALRRSLALAPRAKPARALWSAMEREHEPLRAARIRWPVSAGELWALALGLWWTAGVLAAFGRGPRALLRPLLAATTALALLAASASSGNRKRVGFTDGPATLKQVPHGLAAERGELPALALVTLEQRRGDWWLVRDQSGNRGWVPARVVQPVRGLD
jgi:hypothetical protein